MPAVMFTLLDVIWSDVIWAIFAEVPIILSAQIISVHLKSLVLEFEGPLENADYDYL